MKVYLTSNIMKDQRGLRFVALNAVFFVSTASDFFTSDLSSRSFEELRDSVKEEDHCAAVHDAVCGQER